MSDGTRPTILLVDDDERIIEALKQTLSTESGYDVLAYTSAIKALGDLAGSSMDLVISNYRLPTMDGVTFLREVKNRFPLVPRILLTTSEDRTNVLKAVDSVGLYQYIQKPWSDDDLKLIVRNALEKTLLLRQLEQKIQDVDRIHTELHAIRKDILRVFV